MILYILLVSLFIFFFRERRYFVILECKLMFLGKDICKFFGGSYYFDFYLFRNVNIFVLGGVFVFIFLGLFVCIRIDSLGVYGLNTWERVL